MLAVARETESYQFLPDNVDKGKTEKSTDRSGLCVQAAEFTPISRQSGKQCILEDWYLSHGL